MLKLLIIGLILGIAGAEKIDNYVNLIKEDLSKLPFLLLNISPECKRDLLEYYNGIKNKKPWAVTMLDSMEKFPSGLLLGRRLAIGQFDECISAKHPNFTGQHCMLEIVLKRNSTKTKFSYTPNIPERMIYRQFSYGICIPSTCSSSDLQSVIETFGMSETLKFDIKDDGCNTGRFSELRQKDYFAIGLFLFFLFLALISTMYDIHRSFILKIESEKSILKSFSLYSNFKHLFQISDSLPEMSSIYGIRFLSMTWVVLGHLCTGLPDGYEINNFDKMSFLTNKAAILFTNAYVCVDSFFFLSGLLLCFVFFRELSSKGSYDAPVALIHRYLRLTPALAAVVLFHYTIFSRLSIAPYWKPVFKRMENSCNEYWWTYFLYIQNYYYPKAKKCFSAAWYLCADTQMFILSPLILYFLKLWPKLAPSYLCTLILGSSLITFMVCYREDLPPNRSTDSIRDLFPKSFVDEYVLFYTRMTPWLVGIATGYIICGIRAEKISFRPKRIWVIVGWIVSGLLCLSSVYGIAAFFPYKDYHSALEKSSYRAFHRLGWALGLSWIVVACVTGHGGFVNSFLSLKIFQPLAKLSYCIFLVHLPVQRFRHFNESRSLKYFDLLSGMYNYLGDIILSIAISIPMTLLFEMPFSNIDRILLKNLKILPFPKSQKAKNIMIVTKGNLGPENICDKKIRY